MSDTSIQMAMPRHRVWFVNTVIAFLIAASFWDIVREADHWPFSNYGMYSGVERARTVSVLRVYGVTVAPQHEFALTDFQALQPFDQARLYWGIQYIAGSSPPGTAARERALTDALRDVLMRYERLRLAGRHHLPPLNAVRLYEVAWQLDPQAKNLDQPDRKRLMLEVSSLSGERQPDKTWESPR